MRKFITRLIIKHFYTEDELFDRIRSRNFKKVQKFILYLKQYDPVALENILKPRGNSNHCITPLSSSFCFLKTYEHFQIAIALLESNPELYATLFEWDPDILFSAIEDQELPELHLLFWFVRDGSLMIRDPKTGLSAKQLIIDQSQCEVAVQVRVWHADPRVAQEDSFENAVMSSWKLARRRFRLIENVEVELAAQHYESALQTYKALERVCIEYAQLEARTDYSSSLAVDAKPHLVKFYRDYGQRYVQEAYKACELWLQNFKTDPATLSREQVAEYKRALTQAAALSQQLGNSEAEQRYTAVLSSLPSIELSPAATATHIAPAQIIVSDPSTHRSPYANQASIQHTSSLEEDPCYAP